MPPFRLYDDTARMTRIDDAIAVGKYATRTAAIKGEFGEGILRRLQERYRERDLAERAALADGVARAHADVFPVVAEGGPHARTLRIAVPGDGDGGGRSTLVISLETTPGGIGRGLSCRVTGADARWPGPWGALDALGLSLEVRRGLLVATDGPSPVLSILAATLVAAWSEAGVADPSLADALAVEGARLATGALDELAAALDRESVRVVACYASTDPVAVGAAALAGASPARRTLMASLASLAHPGLATLGDDDVATWAGRPAAVLARLHRGSHGMRETLGRELSEADAAWLMAVVGRHETAPVPPALVPVLVSRRGSIDPARVVRARDAAGMVVMVGAAASLSPRDGQVVDLLLRALSTGADAGRPYGDVAEELWDVAEASGHPKGLMGAAARRAGGGIGAAVAAATLGVERTCEWVAARLLVPTLAAVRSRAAGDGDAEALALHLATDPWWRTTLERHARDVVGTGRSMATLAHLALAFDLWEDADPDLGAYMAPEGEVAAAARSWAARAGDVTALDAAWGTASRFVAPSWRIDGRRSYEDMVACLLPRLSRLPPAPTGPDSLLRGVGRMVGMGRRALGEGFDAGRAEATAPVRRMTT